ncbi:hypothetical protein [Halolamina salifodinae]|uniref:Uncharacterized protein n=1 Tax=Halolamina salifodinae TaxID=1202767 RepID=A0A8T4H1N6_9EURY|nr:hypothetical protein [Halolamina salifodinae]MBP1987228.1 hypothetical protein [Halolamina salifodinae]
MVTATPGDLAMQETVSGLSPAGYVLLAIFGLALGWSFARLAAGADEPREFFAPPTVVDRLAVSLGDRFGTRILGEEPTDDDFERVVKNGLAAAGFAGALGLLALMAAPAHKLLAAAACIVVVLLELGEVLVAYGVSDKPILFTEP